MKNIFIGMGLGGIIQYLADQMQHRSRRRREKQQMKDEPVLSPEDCLLLMRIGNDRREAWMKFMAQTGQSYGFPYGDDAKTMHAPPQTGETPTKMGGDKFTDHTESPFEQPVKLDTPRTSDEIHEYLTEVQKLKLDSADPKVVKDVIAEITNTSTQVEEEERQRKRRIEEFCRIRLGTVLEPWQVTLIDKSMKERERITESPLDTFLIKEWLKELSLTDLRKLRGLSYDELTKRGQEF